MTKSESDRQQLIIEEFVKARLDEEEREARRIAQVPRIRRAIAQVAKDRAILALHRSDDPHDVTDLPECVECGLPYPCQTVRLLAAIDADHPSFDPSWKPVAT